MLFIGKPMGRSIMISNIILLLTIRIYIYECNLASGACLYCSDQRTLSSEKVKEVDKAVAMDRFIMSLLPCFYVQTRLEMPVNLLAMRASGPRAPRS